MQAVGLASTSLISNEAGLAVWDVVHQLRSSDADVLGQIVGSVKNLSVNNISTVYSMAATQSDEGCCEVVEGQAVSG